MEGVACQGIGVIIEGQVARQKYTPTGEFTTLNLLGPGTVFGADLIFSTNKLYPYSLEARTCENDFHFKRRFALAHCQQFAVTFKLHVLFIRPRTRTGSEDSSSVTKDTAT